MKIFFLLYIISFSAYCQFHKPKEKKDTTQTVIKKEDIPKEEKKSLQKMSFFERIYFGGNASLFLGNITLISVSPLIGYRLTERLSFGPGLIYSYYRNTNFSPSYSYHLYGPRLFARYDIIYNIYGYAEYEYLTNGQTKNNAFFLGTGYFQPIYKQSGIMITFLYNFLHKGSNDYYPSPFDIRIGFVFF